MTARPAMVPLDRVDPHPDNVRGDVGDVGELTQSIRANGVLQPVTVEPYGGRYRLVAGHRRVAAARLAGMRQVPAIVRDDLLPDQVVVAMLVENMQRRGLNPMEEARALGRLRRMGHDQPALARQVGKSVAWVSNRLALLELPATEQQAVADGDKPLYDVEEQVREQRRAAAGKPRSAKADRGWDNAPWHLGPTHPLAAGAKHLCDERGHNERRRLRSTGCGICWEDAIRADERRKAEARVAGAA